MKIILTHTDFDGVVSGTLLSIATKTNFIKFVSNQKIWRENLIGDEIIADLPCPWKCQLWFDHHASNINEMKLRGIDAEKIPGKFQLTDSCAQIIYDYFSPDNQFPPHFDDLVKQTSIIDSMKYHSIEEWLKETPVKILSNITQLFGNEQYKDFLHFLIKLSKALIKKPPEELVQSDFITQRYSQFKEYRNQSKELIKNCYCFHKNDKKKSIAILDISEFKTPQRIDKNLIYIFEPEVDAVLLINSAFKNNVKTNDLKFSFGINFTKADQLTHINLSTIFEELDIGGGHPKAAGGSLENDSKEEKLKNKELIIQEIIKKWEQQIEQNPADKS